MTEILLGLEEKNVTSIPVSTVGASSTHNVVIQPTEPDVSRKRRQRQRRRRGTRQSNSAVVEEHLPSDNPEETRRPLVASKRVIFDEDGNHESTVSMSCDEKNTCNRKTQKRSGFFDMKKLIAVTKDNLRSPKSGESSSCTSRLDALTLPHTPEVEVRCIKDQYLETRIYKFPTDYDSIVRYWYLNLDQLARLNQASDQLLTANSPYGCVNNSPDVSTQDVLDNAPEPDHSLDEVVLFKSLKVASK
ncbi:hypothetical protein CSKR_202923 [Clonorchis sinensis]|uniref:Uncharacterized protein n=1 Tax=Clonorchis sinensis TaxID=79923 RepID=A0A8T1M4Z7_CLOSI|nr:hypothetical protein CSKR_202923 [Clonorchis sinensis]